MCVFGSGVLDAERSRSGTHHNPSFGPPKSVWRSACGKPSAPVQHTWQVEVEIKCCSTSRQPALVSTLIKIVRRYAEVLDQQTCWCWSSDTPHSPTATLAVPRPRLCPPAHRRRRHLRHRHPRRPEPHRLNHLTASESAVATHCAASGTRHFRLRWRCCLPVTGVRTCALAYFVGGRSPRNTIAKSFANC